MQNFAKIKFVYWSWKKYRGLLL